MGEQLIAYTLGHTKSYDTAFEQGPVLKQPGGYAFICREAAESYLRSPNFLLDFPGRDPQTFSVYGLNLTVPFVYATEQDLRSWVLRYETPCFKL